MREDKEEGEKGLLWKLPAVKSKHLGKVGPAFGVGAGCGVGLGLGLLGGAGFGPGIPGLQFGFGVGVGCGVGIGFGYGLGRGIAQDENRRYSNIANLNTASRNFPTHFVSYIGGFGGLRLVRLLMSLWIIPRSL